MLNFKVTLCILSLAVILSMASEDASQTLTSKFENLITNFDEIQVHLFV